MSGLGFLGRVMSRRFSTSAITRSEIQQQGIPGSTLPFPIDNPYMLTIGIGLYFSLGLTAPWLMVWHQMNKQAEIPPAH